MEAMPQLKTALLDLMFETKGDDLNLIVVGGYGIHLRREHIRKTRAKTLFDQLPEARSTNDLDLMLRPELLINPMRLAPLAAALTNLKYQTVKGAEHYQFVRPGPDGGLAGSIKIDLLTAPQEAFKDTTVSTDSRRARPKPSVGVHAHPVDEVPTLELGLLAIEFGGDTSQGVKYQTLLHLPQPFTFVMMKLFAFRDRVDDKEKDYGRYHALDIYSVLGTTTENEWRDALKLREQFKDHPFVIEAAKIVDEFFSTPTSRGVLRLKESPYYRRELQVDDFIGIMSELLPGN
jgi:hypothetical protein